VEQEGGCAALSIVRRGRVSTARNKYASRGVPEVIPILPVGSGRKSTTGLHEGLHHAQKDS